jgi:16S rRNA (cytosine967-C5)-methyltransferase
MPPSGHKSSRPHAPLPPDGPRNLAWLALQQARRRTQFVDQALHESLDRPAAQPEHAALATELALGVVRHRLTLSRLISAVLQGQLSRISPPLRDVLFIGAYQLVWLDHVPHFAAVDQAVEQAKHLGGHKAAGLANAVLRQIIRHQQQPRCSFDQADPRRSVRVDYHRACLFDIDLFPDPRLDPVNYHSQATSHPPILVSRWLRHFGLARTAQICWAGQSKPPLCLRPNCLRVSPQQLTQQLQAEGLDTRYDAQRQSLFLVNPPPLRCLQALHNGLAQPQDPTAMAAARRLNPQPGQVVLDLCAAPGTKTTHLAELMQDRGLIIACDTSPPKLEQIQQNCRRLGITIVRTTLPHQLAELRARLDHLDAILLDVPCTNTGALARRPEARYRFNLNRLQSLADLQANLLDHAAALADRHTTILYSTCSIEPEENEHAIQQFCHRHPDWSLIDSLQTLPHCGPDPADWRDGGFLADLRQTAP